MTIVAATHYSDMVAQDGTISFAAVMRFAHHKTRLELARYARCALPAPAYRTLFAHELREALEWAHAMRRGVLTRTYLHPAAPIAIAA